jgi:signal transduction histidine kinase
MDAPAAAGTENERVRLSLRRLPRRDLALAAVLAVAVVLVELLVPDFIRGGNSDAPMPPPTLDGERYVATGSDERSFALMLLVTLLITAPLVVRRRWPLAGFAVQYPVLIVAEEANNVPALLAVLIGVYSVAAYLPAVVSMSVLTGTATVTAAVERETWPLLPGWAGVFVILLTIGLFGTAIRVARGRAEASHERAEALVREQRAATRLALVQERARIARELHDVVSHHVSVMTIQAGAAGKVLDSRPDLARGALSAIEASGRETMAELRHLLGALAGAEATGTADADLLQPQPGLAQLDALVDNVRQAGQPVTVRHTPVTLSHGMDLAAYRVVQEALTNALRHAPGARTTIEIGVQDTDLVVEVTNDEPPAATGPPAGGPGGGTGSGLIGLAERLRLYGGELTTGRRPTGGFRVRASMPLGAS